MRRLYRLPLLVALLFIGLAIVLAVFPWIGAMARERTIAAWSRWLMRSCGTRVREVVDAGGQPLIAQPGGRLLLLNHVSWLDIFAVDSIAPASFVAKAEIARWPLAGTLVARTGTIFIERGKRHAVHAVILQMADKLRQGRRAAVFPEGTTTDGRRLLAFHGNLIEAARESGVPVVPVGLRYLDPDGEPSHAALYIGDTTFLQSLWRITGHPLLIVELHVLAAIPTVARHDKAAPTRQMIAQQARQAIGDRLGLPFDDQVPENLKRARETVVG